MGLISVYHTWTDGYIPMGLINAERLNTNFSRLYTEINGLLDEANIENPCKVLVADRNYTATGLKVSGNWEFTGDFKLTGTLNTIWTLPAADGTSGQAIVTNGSGALSFSTIVTSYWHKYSATDHIYRNEGTVAIGTATPDANHGLHIASDNGILYEPLTATLTSGWIKLRTNFGITAEEVKLGFQWSTNATPNVNLWKQYVTHNNGAEYHDLIFYNDQITAETLRLTGSGAGTTLGLTAILTGSLKTTGSLIVISTAKTPVSAEDAGEIGTICWDTSYIYVCVATNTWKRSAISTWE